MWKPASWGFKALVAGAAVLSLSSVLVIHGPPTRRGFGFSGNLWSRQLRNKDKMFRPWAHKRFPEPAHVRVVVRTQPREELLLRSLIYSLRAQAQPLERVKLDFVLVPTEPGFLSLYQQLQKEMNLGFDDLHLLELPDSFYSESKASQGALECTDAVRASYHKARYDEEEVHKFCDFDHYVYYAATDRALLDWVVPCENCTHVLVTNGDNGYAPGFLDATLRQTADMAIVSFVHGNHQIVPTMALGGLDLGAVLMRVRVLDEGRKLFLTSLPPKAGPKQVHDADYWMVHDAISRGLTYTMLKDEMLMYHH